MSYKNTVNDVFFQEQFENDVFKRIFLYFSSRMRWTSFFLVHIIICIEKIDNSFICLYHRILFHRNLLAIAEVFSWLFPIKKKNGKYQKLVIKIGDETQLEIEKSRLGKSVEKANKEITLLSYHLINHINSSLIVDMN